MLYFSVYVIIVSYGISTFNNLVLMVFEILIINIFEKNQINQIFANYKQFGNFVGRNMDFMLFLGQSCFLWVLAE
jgi:hypothetical protein